MYSFGGDDNFMMIMVFSKKHVNNYLVLNFHSHRPYDLRIIAVRSLVLEMLALWIDLNDSFV